MDRNRAILKMGKIMAVGLLIPIIVMLVEYTYFNSSHGFYPLLGVYAYILIFGSYIKRLHKRINEQYPEDENTKDN